MNRIFTAFCLLSLAGCSVELAPKQLDTTAAKTDKEREAHNMALPGVVYSLPYARFDVSLTWTLKSCDDGKPVVELSGTAKPAYIPDRSKTYVLDYMDLTSPLKTSKFTFEPHENRMLKTFGAITSDQTGPVIVGTVKTIASIAATAAGLRIRSVNTVNDRGDFCTPDVSAALKARKRKEKASEVATQALKVATEQLKALFDIYAALGSSKTNAGTAFLTQAQAVLKLRERSDKAAQDYADTLALVTIVQDLKWPPAQNVFVQRIAIDSEKFETASWFSQDTKLRPEAILELRGNDPLALDIAKVADANLAAAGADPNPDQHLPALPSPGGLTFRQPVQGVLSGRVCQAWGTDAMACESGSGSPIATALIPQLARLQFLPYRNGPFQDNELAASFRENGALEKVTYEEKSSRALNSVTAIHDAAAALQAGIKDVRGAGAAAQLADLKAQVELATQRAALTKALDALSPPKTETEKDQTVLLETNTTLKKAEIANIEATQALTAARLRAPQ